MLRKNLIIAAIAAAAILAGVIFFLARPPVEVSPPAAVFAPPQKNELEQNQKPAQNQPDTAVLQRGIKVTINMPTDMASKITDEIKSLSSGLKQNPDYLQGWLQLGILRKFIGDYEGAALAWQAATEFRPDDFIAFSNLGDLYHFYVKDPQKSEKYTKEALSLKPDFIQGYKDLADLYRYIYKEKSSEAAPTILDGLKKNPQNPDLLVYLGSYYEDLGDKANARKYFEEALKSNPPNSAAIEAELNTLSLKQ